MKEEEKEFESVGAPYVLPKYSVNECTSKGQGRHTAGLGNVTVDMLYTPANTRA